MSGLVNMLSVFETFDFCDGNWWVAMLLQLVYGLLTLVSKIMGLFADLMHIAFYVFAGIDLNSESTGVDGIYNIEVAEGRKNILDYFLFSDTMTKAYISLAVIGLLLVVIFTIYRIIKQDYFDRTGPRSKGPIFRNVAISCISFVLVIPIFYLIIHASSLLAVSVMSAMGMSADEFAGAKIFQLSWSDNGEAMRVVNKALSGEPYASEAKFQWMWNLHGQTLFSMMADGKYVKYDTTIMKALGKIDKDGNVIPWPGKLAMINNQGVGIYGEFYWYVYLVGIWAALPVLKDMIFAMIQRIFKLMALFLVAPAPISRYVLDDGATYKKWQKQSIEQGLRVVSATMCFSIYLIALNLIAGVNFIQPFLNAVDHATHPNPEPQALLNVSTSLLADNGDKGSIGDFVGGVYDFVSKDVIVGSDDLGNPFYSLVNVFMKIILIMGAGGAVKDMDAVVMNMIIDGQAALESNETGKGLTAGMGIVSNTVSKAVSLGAGAVKGVAGAVGGIAGSVAGAVKGSKEIDLKEREGRKAGIEKAKEEDKKPPVNEKPPVDQEKPVNNENPNGVDDNDDLNTTKDVNPQNIDEEKKDDVQENIVKEEEKDDEQENIVKEEKKDDVQENSVKEEEKKDPNAPSVKKRGFLGNVGRRLWLGTGILSRRVGAKMGVGALRMPFKLANSLATAGTKGMDALLNKVGFTTNFASAYATARDGIFKGAPEQFKKSKKEVEDAASKRAERNKDIHYGKGYRKQKQYDLRKSQQVMDEKFEQVMVNSTGLDNAINKEKEALNQVNATGGQVSAAKAIADQANGAIDINKQVEAVETAQSENEVYKNKYGLSNAGEVRARLKELENNGDTTSQEYKDLTKYDKNLSQIDHITHGGTVTIDELKNRQQRTNILTNKDGVLSKLGIDNVEKMSFNEIKKIIDTTEDIPSEIKDAFSHKDAEKDFNSTKVETAREANTNLHVAETQLDEATTRYQTAQTNTSNIRKQLQESVQQFANAESVVNNLYDSVDKNSTILDENGYFHRGQNRRVHQQMRRKIKNKTKTAVIRSNNRIKHAFTEEAKIDLLNKEVEQPKDLTVQSAIDYLNNQNQINDETFNNTVNGLTVNIPNQEYIDKYREVQRQGGNKARFQFHDVVQGATKEKHPEIYDMINSTRNEDGTYDMVRLANIFKNGTRNFGEGVDSTKLNNAYNKFVKNISTNASKAHLPDIPQSEQVSMADLVKKHGSVDNVKKFMIEHGTYEENKDVLNTYDTAQRNHEHKKKVLSVATTAVEPIVEETQGTHSRIVQNVTRFETCARNVTALNKLIANGGNDISLTDKNIIQSILGTKVNTKDPSVIVQLATKAREFMVQEQKDLYKNTNELDNKNSELIGSLKTIIDSLATAITGERQGNSNITNNVINNIRETSNIPNISEMSAQEWSMENYQKTLSENIHNMLDRSQRNNEYMQRDVQHIRETVDEMHDDDN